MTPSGTEPATFRFLAQNFVFVIQLHICNLVCLKMAVFGRKMWPYL